MIVSTVNDGQINEKWTPISAALILRDLDLYFRQSDDI
jgi:hypothetical protein